MFCWLNGCWADVISKWQADFLASSLKITFILLPLSLNQWLSLENYTECLRVGETSGDQLAQSCTAQNRPSRAGCPGPQSVVQLRLYNFSVSMFDCLYSIFFPYSLNKAPYILICACNSGSLTTCNSLILSSLLLHKVFFTNGQTFTKPFLLQNEHFQLSQTLLVCHVLHSVHLHSSPLDPHQYASVSLVLERPELDPAFRCVSSLWKEHCCPIVNLCPLGCSELLSSQLSPTCLSAWGYSTPGAGLRISLYWSFTLHFSPLFCSFWKTAHQSRASDNPPNFVLSVNLLTCLTCNLSICQLGCCMR